MNEKERIPPSEHSDGLESDLSSSLMASITSSDSHCTISPTSSIHLITHPTAPTTSNSPASNLSAQIPSHQTFFLDASTASSSQSSIPSPSTSNTFAEPSSTPPMYCHHYLKAIYTFVATATSSPMLLSALTAIDAAEAHPLSGQQATTSRGGLRWTLASLLALYIRTGRTTLDHEDLLAMLWTMESWADARRSPATTVLGDYVRHIAAFDNDLARSMCVSWEDSFVALRKKVVDCQRAFLADVQWKVGLDDNEILSAYQVLFGSECGRNGTSFVAIAGGKPAMARAAMAKSEAFAAAASVESMASTAGVAKSRWTALIGGCASRCHMLCARVWMYAYRIQAAVPPAAVVPVARVQKEEGSSETSNDENCNRTCNSQCKRQRIL